MSNTPSLTLEDVRGVAPALAHYTETAIIGDLWARSGLSARDRSLVTVSALVAGERTIGFAHYFTRALDSGVTPGELSELITHVAFYAGWSTAFNAVAIPVVALTRRLPRRHLLIGRLSRVLSIRR